MNAFKTLRTRSKHYERVRNHYERVRNHYECVQNIMNALKTL